MHEGPMVVKNLSTGPIWLDVVIGEDMNSIHVVGRGFYEVPEQATVANLKVLKDDHKVVVLKLRSIRHLLRKS